MKQVKSIKLIKFLNLISKISGLNVVGFTWFPFIFTLDGKKSNHESVHWYQGVEFLILYLVNIIWIWYFKGFSWWYISGFIINPMYIFYVLNYLWNYLMVGNTRKAYKNIIFEKEAYLNTDSFNYLEKRKPFGWIKH